MSGMKAEKLLVNSELLKFYLQYGLEVTKIYDIYKFQAQAVFKPFQEQITAERRSGISNAKKTTTKLIGVCYKISAHVFNNPIFKILLIDVVYKDFAYFIFRILAMEVY